MKRELWYLVVVRDRHGKVVSRERRKSKSFVRGWNDVIYIHTTGASDTVKDIGGVVRAITPMAHQLKMLSLASKEDEWSIAIGTGDTAVTISDYALEAVIPHGTGAGEMSYQDPTVNESVVSAPNCGFLVERAFVNNSGAEITVKESTIYSPFDAPGNSICLIRDVFVSPQAVPNGGSLSMNYTLRVTA
ncbi:hypothetical protein ES706_06142 [subsurface metagenome]